VLLSGFGALFAGSGLLGLLPPSWPGFLVATMLVGLGVGIVVGGTLRTLVLDEVSDAERSAAQALVNIFIAIGNLLVVASLSVVADTGSGGAAGLSRAYLVAAGVMAVMMALSLTLRRRPA
jgi:FtsH-binding integral membrane protein